MRSHGSALFLGLLVLPAALCGYSWVARYNGTGNGTDQAAGIALDGSGNAYVTGYSTGTGPDILTVKYDPDGDTLWTRRYTGAGSNADVGSAVVYDPAGYVCVAGMTTGASADFAILKYDAATGALVWSRTYDGPAAGRDSAGAVALDASGNVYAAGYTRVNGHSEATVVKYNSSGTYQWARRITFPLSFDTLSAVTGLVIDASQNPCLCGRIGRSGDRYDYLTAKLNPATGDTYWVRRYNGPRDSTDVAYALAVDAAGNVYVTGTSWSTTQFDYLTVKYSSAGVQQWEARYDGPADDFDEAYAIGLDASGSAVLVTGYSTGSGNASEDWATVKYSPAGVQQWATRYNGGSNGDDNARAIEVDASGNTYVAGFSESGNDFDVYLVKYDPSGAALWSSRYNYAANLEDQAVALAVLSPGVAYLAGFSFGGSPAPGFDYLTMKYLEHDVAVTDWLGPSGTMTPQPVVPEARVHNYGAFSETTAVHLWIYRNGVPVYSDVQTAAGVSANGNYDVSFRVFTGDTGTYVVRCSTALPTDMNPANDADTDTFVFRWAALPYWVQKPNVPAGPSMKPVKDGAALCYGRCSPSGWTVYALKGNNTNEFMRCHVNNTSPYDTWHLLDSMPCAEERARRVKKGGALCHDRYDSAIYALKGNNTREFWKFDIVLDSWIRRADIPVGLSNKKVKGGSALVFYHSTSMGDRVYALKGNKRDELWCYRIEVDSWELKKSVPLGLSGKGMGDGSCMANANNVFYALKGNYNEFYAYYPTGDSWVQKESLPMYGRAERRRKAKYGSAVCYGNDVIYGIKGGCNEFWGYYPDADTWIELDTMPRFPSLKPVKNGGALTYGNGYIWALKGNKTNEFWCYYPGDGFLSRPAPPDRGGARAGQLPTGDCRMAIAPNPLVSGFATIRLSPITYRHSPCAIRVFDAAGRCVQSTVCNLRSEMALDLRGLRPGVYLVMLASTGFTAARKLIVQR